MGLTTRRARLMPNGEPRYVHCYDNNGKTADRYTVVFTGRYRHKTGGSFLHVGMSANPFHPQGVGMHGESDRQIDYPRYAHLGRRVRFDALPPACQRLILQTYRELWDIPADTQPKGEE